MKSNLKYGYHVYQNPTDAYTENLKKLLQIEHRKVLWELRKPHGIIEPVSMDLAPFETLTSTSGNPTKKNLTRMEIISRISAGSLPCHKFATSRKSDLIQQ